MRIWIFRIGLAALLGMPLGLAAAPAWQTCHLPGQRDALHCAAIAVPRDYADASRGSFDVHVAVARSIRTRAEADPLFVLAGGPGQAGSDIVLLLDTALAKVRASRDIVFIDQRGTGRSGRLGCADDADALTLSDSELQASTLACLKGFGPDLLLHTTAAAVEDLERVRQSLGYARINLWGASYGSRLAQAYAQRYPTTVRSLILDGVVDADLIIGAESYQFQAALDAVLQRCADDADCRRAFPALRTQLRDVLQRLDADAAATTLAHPRSGQPAHVRITRQRLLQTIRHLLYSTRGAAQLPYLIARADVGDWRPLLAIQASSVDLAAAQPAAGVLLAIACREDWPRLTAAQRAREAQAGVFGAAGLASFDELCGALALPPLPPSSVQTLTPPALLLSGALDPVTPPIRADRALRTLPQGQHVVAAHAGHVISGLGCTPALLRRFLDAPLQTIDATCLGEIVLPAFQTSAAGASP